MKAGRLRAVAPPVPEPALSIGEVLALGRRYTERALTSASSGFSSGIGVGRAMDAGRSYNAAASDLYFKARFEAPWRRR